MEKTAATVIEGEALDILVGSAPLCGEEKDAVAANVLKLLKETYSMEKEDLMSAELEIVPAGKARDCGLDKSMVIGYGQDDRVCAFTSLMAMLHLSLIHIWKRMKTHWEQSQKHSRTVCRYLDVHRWQEAMI